VQIQRRPLNSVKRLVTLNENGIEPLSGYKVFVGCCHFIAKTPRREGAKEHVTENGVGKILGKLVFRMPLDMSDRIQSGAVIPAVQRGDCN
jgi:hypothetical protein